MLEFLPMFPLQLVAFPKERLNLHVFEARYIQMMNEAEANQTTFGIPAYINKKVKPIGTELRLVKIVKRYKGGKMDVKTEGIRTFKIRNFFKVAPDKLYAGAQVEMRKNDFDIDILTNQKILNLLERLYKYLKIKKEVPTDPSVFNTFDLAHHVGFSIDQEYELLTLQTEVERQAYMHQHLESLLPVVEKMEDLRRRVQMNGHFKNILPPDFK